MNKKNLILLAEMIKDHNKPSLRDPFTQDHLNMLAAFCAKTNPNFNRERWMDFIKGRCGPNGGEI